MYESYTHPNQQQQQQQQHLSSSRQMNLLHGVPTTMEPKQLASLQHSAQSLRSINVQVSTHGDQGGQSNSLLVQMSQSQPRMSILNENSSNQVPRFPSSVGQPIRSNPITGGILTRNGLAENGRGAIYNPVPQSSSTLDIPLNNSAELTGNSFPLGSTPGISSLTSKGAFQEDVNSELKVPGGFMPSYDIFGDLHQHKSNEWELQNAGLTFHAAPLPNSLQGNLGDGPSALPQRFPPGQSNGQNRNTSAIGKPIFSAEDATDCSNNLQGVGQNLNTFFTESSVRVKTEGVPDASCQTVFPEQFGQDDLMSALLKQQQGGISPAENEFDFDGYAMDNIQV
uniref:Uncharacterized protein n=1 Tax=Rhizophora mucronata TaxID=61149 RepID=A0A2P2LXZ5_RHIMU